jgi:hypothetical protein
MVVPFEGTTEAKAFLTELCTLLTPGSGMYNRAKAMRDFSTRIGVLYITDDDPLTKDGGIEYDNFYNPARGYGDPMTPQEVFGRLGLGGYNDG